MKSPLPGSAASRPRGDTDDGALTPAATATAAPSGAPARDRPAWLRKAAQWHPTAEQLAVLALGMLVLVVHNVGYILDHPYWSDEAWVAVTTRFPLSQLPAVTSSTPIGWSALVRLVTVPGTQTGRLLPLAFSGATVVAAYWFARSLGWRWQAASVAAGLAAGIGALFVPAMLQRNDLKQYTAEAFTAVVTLALTSRLEREWSRKGLAALSVSVWLGMLISNAVAFVGVAAFVALCIVQIARRAWRRAAEVAVAGAATGVLMLGVYKAFDARAVAPLKTSPYWPHYYVPVAQGLHASITFVAAHLHNVLFRFGLGPLWLAVPLVIAGLITIVRLGRPATAIAVAVLWPEMVILSALKAYPFLTPRTSTFLFVITVVVAAVGVIGVCSLMRPWLKGGVAAGLAACAVAAFVLGAQPFPRSFTIANEDVRGQALYVATHAAADDVIVVNLDSNWGFAYYWPIGRPARRADTAVRQLYEAYFPGQPRIIVARDRNQAAVNAALAQALARARHHSCSRIWLVRTHLSAAERAAWAAALRQQGLSTEQVVHNGLRVIQVRGASCR